MVFESIITDVMNRFLGDFIENLDTKQLNVGIWGGDVVLRDLRLKQSALKDLDLPVQLIYGCLGKLVLKIPWKNLYSLPVVADVEDLYVLVAPNSAVIYNAEKQDKSDLEYKKSELQKFDDVKKREEERDKLKADKSFTEKLVAQIINNVQIRLKNVHIRYEDRITSQIPFSIGITLGSLEVHTTDCDWEKTFISESLSKIFKVAKLDGLAIYMNCNAKIFQSHLPQEYNKMFLESIATKDVLIQNYTYVLGPINSTAKLQLNMHPETDDPQFVIPKVDLCLEMEKLAVGITKSQYQRLIELADSMGYMNRGVPYRKYRPFDIPYKGNYKTWWHFAYTCIIETEIKRKKRDWTWSHMLEHRTLCKSYAESLYLKLTVKKPKSETLQIVEKCEIKLDIFNLMLIKRRVQLEVEKSGKLHAAEQAEKKTSWFGSWWGGSNDDNENKDDNKDIVGQFMTAMTPEEKAKLYSAIGYSEGGVPTELPQEYIALVMRFKLNKLEVCIQNESIQLDNGKQQAAIHDTQENVCTTVLSLQVLGVVCEVDQRPAASGLRVDLNMKEFTVFGYQQEEFLPIMVQSKIGPFEDRSLIDVNFEMNPIDKSCDQRVTVAARPLQIVYDAETIIQLVNVFKMPKNANLSDLTDAATDKISNIKERSATGIQYMVEKHTQLDVNISVMPNLLIVPYGGSYKNKNNVPVMVISLGKISLKSEPRLGGDVAEMHGSGKTSDEILKEMLSQAYDKFNLDIQNIQILLAKPSDDWENALIDDKITELHILEPTSMFVTAHMCVVDDDPRLPKTKILAKLPSIGVSVTEEKVLDALSLVTSIPLPESDETAPMPLKESGIMASSKSLKRYLDEKQQKKLKTIVEKQQKQELSAEIVQYTDLDFSFVMNELSINIYKSGRVLDDSTPTSQYRTPTEEFNTDAENSVTDDSALQHSKTKFSLFDHLNVERQLSFKIKQLEMGMVQRTYDMKVALKLGAISMDQYHKTASNDNVVITMIETPCYADNSGYLFSLYYTSANKSSPEFTSKYKSTEQLIEINFTILILRLHQEGLTELLQFANNFQTKIEVITKESQKKSTYRIASAGDPLPLPKISEEEEDGTAVAVVTKNVNKKLASVVDSIKLKLLANMVQMVIQIENDKRSIAHLKIENLNTNVIMKTSYTEVSVKLQDIIVLDKNTQTIHPTILSVVGGNALACQLVLYNLDETSVYNSDDMKIDVSMGCVKIVFLNWFVNSVLNFLDNFQAAQKAIAEASAAAAETAKQNMVEAYTNATRMRLNIKIKAPLIIVPVDSQSNEAISIDLGYLHISNTISEIQNSAKDRGPAILDDMRLELKEMKLSKVHICSDDANTSQIKDGGDDTVDAVYGLRNNVNILNPTTFALLIKRNLSAGWYKEIPELDVSGRLKSIVVNLMNADYKMIMSILAKNMTEGADERKLTPPPPPPPSQPTPQPSETKPKYSATPSLPNQSQLMIAGDGVSSTVVVDPSTDIFNYDDALVSANKKLSKAKLSSTEVSLLNSPDATKSKIDTFLKFAFQMDSIILNLFNECGSGLATFGIHYLSLKGYKLVDDSLSASIVLCDVQLDDSRPERENYITKFMKKRENDSGVDAQDVTKPSISMVDIVVRIKENDTFANLRVCSFDLILSLEFLLKIGQFMSIEPDAEMAVQTTADSNKSSSAAKPKASTSTVAVQQPTPPTDPNKKMTILINIEQPDIILVEKMDDINCLALILNTQMALRVQIQGERQIIRGEISDLKFYMCEFNPLRRNATKHFVLQPCTISLHGTTPEANGMHISLSTSDIRINISPTIIELLNKTLTTVTASEQKNSETLKELEDHSNLWKTETYKEDDFWFMKIDECEEVLVAENLETAIVEAKPEVCIVEVPSIVIVIETGCGYYAYPMLIVETKINAEIRNWSSDMAIESSLCLGMAYYNSVLAVWEPLIEPNEREKSNGLIEYGPWELNFNLNIEKNQEDNLSEAEPKTKIAISSSDTLEMSVTKTFLDVLQDLTTAFSDAIRPEGLCKPDVIAPYIIENDTGFDITLNLLRGDLHLHSSHLPNSNSQLDDSIRSGVVFKLPEMIGGSAGCTELEPKEVTVCKISPGGKAYLQAKTEESMTVLSAFSSLNKAQLKEMSLFVQIGDIEKEVMLPIHKADRRYFPLYRDTNKEPWGVISHVRTEYGSTIITIHGVLKIKNHFTTTINVFRNRNGELIEVGQVKPGASFNVPLHALYAVHKDLYFSIAGYRTSVIGMNWKEHPSDFKFTKYLQCDPISTFEPFYITAIREREEVYHEVTSKFTMLSACYVIHLKPPLYLRNALPIDIHVSVAGCSVSQQEPNEAEEACESSTPIKNKSGSLERPKAIHQEDFLDYGEKIVKPGDVLHLPTVKTTVKEGDTKSYIVARLVQYLEKDWSCTTEIPAVPPEFTVWSFNSYDSEAKMSIELGVRFENRHGSLQLTVYCPYWMINKTGLMLSYRKSRKTEKHEMSGNSNQSADENVNVLYHPPALEGPILFSYREKVFFGKKKASVRIDSGDWSDKFALDAAGSTGVVECKANDIQYEIAVQNALTHNSLTKQLTFIPFYVIMNKASFTIEVQEDKRPGDPWTCIESDKCVPLWPKSDDNRMLRVKAMDDVNVSRPFKYTEVQCTLLKMNNKYGGINVDVQVTEGGIYITFLEYHHGDAPALIMNHTGKPISFWEKGNVNERILNPYEKMLYTWEDPAGDRIILWNEGDKQIENDLRRDGVNEFKHKDQDETCYWVSFLDGTQRILLFTNHADIATEAHSASRLDKVSQEIVVDIHGIGLSLVNNMKQCDIMYIRIASSGVIWEEKKKSRYFKQMKIQEVHIMEEKYQEWLRDCQVGSATDKLYTLDSANKIKIDYDGMQIQKSSLREIRRTFYPGMWIQIKSSPYQLQLHAKINRIQIDNQLIDCIFPVVLAPVPPPKSVAATTELKPFVECSIVQRIIPHSDVKQFKYLTVLMQEFHVKVDLLFINEIIEMVSTEITDEESRQKFAEDIHRQQEPLSALVLTQSSQEQKNFYDQLHLGPLKIHISFSMAGLEPGALPPVLGTILQGVGVTLTDINDIVFRLAFFEREYNFFTQRQLTSEIASHYTGQAIKQAYVLVLGLDVIGNPYGLVVGLTKGVEDLFYEPFQGAIQGPGEFAEGLVLGVRSLFGHTVGGAAGAVSKITGAMGKGLAALTFDKDYQKKRREQLNKKPANLQEGLARSGKGLVMGVVDGVTGVFTKPISGAKSDGVEGFFKGLGKGAVGLVARPTAGIVDFASGSFDAVKRAADMSEDVIRLRPPRFLHADGIVRPYCHKDAEGNKLLKEIEKGKYASSDVFGHYEVIGDRRILLTDHRLLYCVKNDLFGGWQVEWTYRWNEIDRIITKDKGIEVVIIEKTKKVLGIFGSSEQLKKFISISQSPANRDRIAQLIEKVRITAPSQVGNSSNSSTTSNNNNN